MVVWYFEEGGVVLWRGWCATLKMVVWYFEEGGVVLWRGWCGTSKRVVWHFEEGGVVLWRGWCATLKMVVLLIIELFLDCEWECFVCVISNGIYLMKKMEYWIQTIGILCYLYRYKWNIECKQLELRIAYFEEHWLYMAGFGMFVLGYLLILKSIGFIWLALVCLFSDCLFLKSIGFIWLALVCLYYVRRMV